MKYRLTNYSFHPAAKTIAFPGQHNLKLEGFLVISNATTGTLIYNFADSTLTGTYANSLLTLTYNTASMAVTDSLQIWYDDGINIAYDPKIDFLEQIVYSNMAMLKATVMMLNILDGANANYTVQDFLGD